MHRNPEIVRTNLPLLDAFIKRRSDLFEWESPTPVHQLYIAGETWPSCAWITLSGWRCGGSTRLVQWPWSSKGNLNGQARQPKHVSSPGDPWRRVLYFGGAINGSNFRDRPNHWPHRWRLCRRWWCAREGWACQQGRPESIVSMKWRYSDETYNNQFATHLLALLSISRLLDDGENLKAVLDGGKGSRTVKLPWIELFDHIIYGPNDTPLLNITPNSSVDPVKSHPGYQTAIVAAGEINDRYRHGNPSQGMGCPMGSLEALHMSAEILKNSGLDAYGYRGAHGQSIEMATQYYACFAKYAGFAAMVTKENSRQCPDARQYWGMVVNAVQPNLLVGAYRFPQNQALTELEVPARASFVKSSGSLEPILFGKWRDATGSVQ